MDARLENDGIKFPRGAFDGVLPGFSKNTTQLYTLFAPSDLWMVRRTLLKMFREINVSENGQGPCKRPKSTSNALPIRETVAI